MEEQTKCYCGHTTTCDCGPEEPKQETLEEAAERMAYDSTEENKGFPQMKAFINGAKWQQQQDKNKYSEEEVLDILFTMSVVNPNNITEWFEQFKNKL